MGHRTSGGTSASDDACVIDWPLRGECLVLNPPGHARWAFDVLPVDARTGRLTERGRLFAPRDFPNALLVQPLRHRGDLAAMAGNHLLVASSAGVVLLAHLRRRSLRVRPGQSVAAGEIVGEIGNSGNSVAPHLHLQVMNGDDPTSAAVGRSR